jgi:hypothetical protein
VWGSGGRAGVDEARALALVRAAWRHAIDALPPRSCPAPDAARCSADGRFVAWCRGGVLLTDACWDRGATCVRPAAAAGACAD